MFNRTHQNDTGPVGRFSADEVECLVTCARNGYTPAPDAMERLCRLRQEVLDGGRDELFVDEADVKRLQFARYLYLIGTINEAWK